MRKAMGSLVAIGVGAAAYSMSSRKTKRRFNALIQPMTRLDFKRMRKKIVKTLR